MYRIRKRFHFSASHRIATLPETHPCARLHGHNYTVEVELQAAILDRHGFVRDFGELNALRTYIRERFDHQHLNEVVGDENTSSERLAEIFYRWCKERWPEVRAVRVSESETTWAEYRP